MFSRWGHTVSRHPRSVLLVSLLAFALAITGLMTISPDFSSEGFVSENAESTRVLKTLENQFGQSPNTIVFVFDTHAPVTDQTRAQVERILSTLDGNPHIASIETAWSGQGTGMISNDGTSTYAVAHLKPGELPPYDDLDAIRSSVDGATREAGYDVQYGGIAMANQAINDASAKGIARAEMVAIPITLFILVLVFGSLVAAALPLVIGAFSITTALAVMAWWSSQDYQSNFAANVVTMLGLGLGIDYSLFMIRRFRDELKSRSTEDALVRTMETVGKAILFAGVTVILGLAATMFFPLPVLHSLGQAGMVVTFMAMMFGLTLLPAMLSMIGTRINRFHIGPRGGLSGEGEGGFWHGLANLVMARPVVFLAASLVLMLVLANPVRDLTLSLGGPEMLPKDTPERQATERLKTDFPADDSDVVLVIVRTPGQPIASRDGMTTLTSVSDKIAAIDKVTDVQSVASIPLPWAQWDGNVSRLPGQAQAAFAQTVRDDMAIVSVSSTASSSADQTTLVNAIRDLNQPNVQIQVGGMPGAMVDTLQGMQDGLAPAIAFVAIGAYIILFLSFGSVLLPLKAIFMGALSIIGSLGVVVWVFQNSTFENLLNFTANGTIVAMSPVLIACVLFGLSMDYEVLMLSRIQEEYQRTGDNRRSVAVGLAETGQVISGAATIMVVVFAAFLLADVVAIKSLGFGLAFAVLIDATIVRGLLVPSTMRLLGSLNWWAPRPMQVFVRRLGLSHA